MGYHLIVATAGIAALLAGWLAVQRLSAAGSAVPNAAPAAPPIAGCGGCANCGPTPAAEGPGGHAARARDAPRPDPSSLNPSGPRPSCC